MNVQNPEIDPAGGVSETGAMDIRQRRALARLGLGSTVAYVAPTLLTLRTVAVQSRAAIDAAA